MKLARHLALIAVLSFVSSCALMFNDKQAEVTINSNPAGADILLTAETTEELQQQSKSKQKIKLLSFLKKVTDRLNYNLKLGIQLKTVNAWPTLWVQC